VNNGLRKVIFFALLVTLTFTGYTFQISASIAAPAGSQSSTWKPVKPVTFVIWAAPGGGSDVYARTLASVLMNEYNFPVTINVESHQGGSGAVGMNYVLSQPADGYTVLVTTASWLLSPQTQKMPIGHKNFDPIALVFSEPDGLYVSVSAPYNNLEEFVTYAKKHPGEIRINGTGSGGRDEICMINFMKQVGIELTYVPSDGGGESIINVLGGHVEGFISNPAEAAAQVEAGTMKQIVNFGTYSVGTIKSIVEEGYPKAVSIQLRGLALRGGTDPEIRQWWENTILAISGSETLKKYAKENYIVSEFKSGEEFFRQSNETYDMYTKVLKELGII
jgi:tripartite-type tricarboxylate transporter receptor subunit TctC